MMKYFLFLITFLGIGTLMSQDFQLKDYLNYNAALEAKTDSIFNTLDDTAVVAQLIMPAIGKFGQTESVINSYVRKRQIGGLLMLNGTKESFTKQINSYNSLNASLQALPFLYSADAEPSLVNRKIIGSTVVKKANEIKSEADVSQTASMISKDLNDIGINYNFAPVVDMSKNTTVGYRGFGTNPENIVPFSKEFIRISQDSFNIIATAKHFPGHGLVSGDSHKELQVINGELKEIQIYPPLIADGVLSIMIGHIAVMNNEEYNTNGLPATCSKKIVTDLLRDSLNFQGLIVTDAMNMGGVSKVSDANVKVVEAGCDILLMPLDAAKAHTEILAKFRTDESFKNQVEKASKRIIRMKICLGLL